MSRRISAPTRLRTRKLLIFATGVAVATGGTLVGPSPYEDRAFVVRLPVKAAIDCGGASKPDFGPPETVPDWESWEAP